LVSNAFGVNLAWLETGQGEMFYDETEQDVKEIIDLYRKLNPFFKEFIIKQLRELVEYNENSSFGGSGQ